MMREPDVNGYYECDNAPGCSHLVDEDMYSLAELAGDDVPILCPRCRAIEYVEDWERMEIW